MSQDLPLSQHDEPLPEAIGPYRVTGYLGRGGMGVVLRGYDDRLDRPVALKRVQLGARDPETARRRFRREARAAACLSHQSIVQIYDWAESDHGDWLVMELIDGRRLDHILEREGPLKPGRAIHIARQVADGLAAAHASGLVHRDLKPSNVMVVPRTAAQGAPADLVKILDFGIAKKISTDSGEVTALGGKISSLTADGGLLGTAASMSPEQAMGWPVDTRSDLFSLGSMLYETLSGFSPFRADGPMETLRRVCKTREEPLTSINPEISAGLSNLVHHLLEKEPARRPPSARSVVAELDRLTSSDSAYPPAPHLSPPLEPTLPDGSTCAADLPGIEPSDARGPRGLSRRSWAMIAAAVLLAAWAALPAWRPAQWLDRGRTSPGATSGATEDLDAYQLYQRGMESLDRYDKIGNIDAAIADFQRAQGLDPEAAPALAGLAQAYWLDYYAGSLDPQRLEQARAAADRAVQVGEYLAEAHISSGFVDLEQGNSELAARAFHKALELEPLNAQAHYGLARLNMSLGDNDLAEAKLREAIQLNPTRWQYFATLGQVQLQRGQYTESERSFRGGLDLAPSNFFLLRNLAAAHYMLGDLAAAASDLQKALAIRPTYSIYTNLGAIYFAQGLYPQAVAVFEKAVDTRSGALTHVSWANLADAYRWTPDHQGLAADSYARAIELVDESLEAKPRDSTLRTQRILYLAKKGDCTQASSEVELTSDLAASEASAWYRIAVANEVCGHRSAALSALEVALNAGFALTETESDPELLQLRLERGFQDLKRQASGS